MVVVAHLAVLSMFDTSRNLLFVHIPKNAGSSLVAGVSSYVANETTAQTCKGYDYLGKPEGAPGRKAAIWVNNMGEHTAHTAQYANPEDLLVPEKCPHTLYPQCDLTQQGMGCICGPPGGVAHQSEEYVRAEMTVCSHDGLPPILAPNASGVVKPVVSYAMIRHPMVDGQRFEPLACLCPARACACL